MLHGQKVCKWVHGQVVACQSSVLSDEGPFVIAAYASKPQSFGRTLFAKPRVRLINLFAFKIDLLGSQLHISS